MELNARTVLLVAIALILAGCGTNQSIDTGATTLEQPGNPAVYERIASESGCDELQQEFDRASATHDALQAGSERAEWSLGYMNATDARMREVGCYG